MQISLCFVDIIKHVLFQIVRNACRSLLVCLLPKIVASTGLCTLRMFASAKESGWRQRGGLAYNKRGRGLACNKQAPPFRLLRNANVCFTQFTHKWCCSASILILICSNIILIYSNMSISCVIKIICIILWIMSSYFCNYESVQWGTLVTCRRISRNGISDMQIVYCR